jgi:hypothetical protein
MQKAGIGGVLSMEVSGPWWAPDGPVKALTPEWHEAMQWAIAECQRLGLEFDLSLDFGYGSGGPHITPALSMQQLVWSETTVPGGQRIERRLDRAIVKKDVSAWLRPGAQIGKAVLDAIEQADSYRDVAVVAIPIPGQEAARAFRIPRMEQRNGLRASMAPAGDLAAVTPAGAVVPAERVVDLTSRMDGEGRLAWDAPAGVWLILRYGHASNFKMTRPCPAAAVGLECDRLSPVGVETHYGAFLKKLFTNAGAASGRALSYVHIDSWEAGGQNWTATFPAEFRRRRGYDVVPWLPVLAGRVVGIHRFNTWWNYAQPWMDYLARCQYLLQAGLPAAGVCYWFGEGAPLPAGAMNLAMPEGYDYDLCSSEIVLQL